VNFVSSITLAFKDAFSSGFNDAKNSLAGMRGALDEINKNQSMNRLAADMAMMTSLTDPARWALSNMMDEPSRLAGTFESSMKNIQAITGLASDEIDSLGAELLSIGGKAAAGPQAVADAYNDVAGGITKVNAQMPVLNNALALAEAGQADLGVAANGLVKIMNSYNFTAGEAAEVNERAAWASDVMTQAVGMGVGSMNEFVSAMAPISGMAASVGVGFDEIGSTMAYMTATTDTAASAGTKLQAFMAALQRPSDALAAALGKVGIVSGSAMLAEYGLAESAKIVSDAFNGDQDAIAQAMGRMEAMKAVISLTGDTYSDFAAEFGSTMDGITERSQAIQVESYESKLARLEAASASLQMRIGQDINGIKGFFVDMKSSFLSDMVAPLMSSPVGGAVSKIAAFAGLGAKSILDMGSGALTTATQLTVLTANISNAGGIAKLFSSSLGLIKSGAGLLVTPLKALGGGVLGMGKSIIGALPGIGGWIASMWSSAAATFAAAAPILGIIAGVAALAAGVYLLVKNWSAVSGFFVGLWDKIKGAFSAAWDWIKNLIFGTSDWILGAVAIFMPIIGIPALIIKHWDAVKTFFINLWNDPKAAILGFIDWIGGKVEAFTAPFRAIGDVVSGVFSKIGGFFKSIVGGGEESGSQLNNAFAGGIQSSASAPVDAFGTSLQGVARQMPHSDAPEGPLSKITASGHALTDTFASGMDENVLREKAAMVFSAAMPQGDAALEFPFRESSAPQETGSQVSLFDFVRMIMQSVHRPEEVPV
jgi:TP901 family phage tail tape measure protein